MSRDYRLYLDDILDSTHKALTLHPGLGLRTVPVPWDCVSAGWTEAAFLLVHQTGQGLSPHLLG